MATTYVVYRVGSNAANQHMTQRMPVGTFEADQPLKLGPDFTTAARTWEAAHPEVTLYNNQHLDFVPRSRVPRRDWETLAREQDAQSQPQPF